MLAAGYAWRLPLDASTHGGAIDALIHMVHWFMSLLFVGWGIFFVYCLVRFRQRAGHEAVVKLPKAKPSKLVELIVVIVEAVLLLGFSIPVWAQVRGSGHLPNPEDALVVRVVAEQFQWNIHYPGRDGVFGRTEQSMMGKENPVGLDRSDSDAKDDIVTINVMHVPVGKQILVHLTSKDVIHSFALPLLRIKQDVIPGMSTPIWFEAAKTTDAIRDAMARTYMVEAVDMSMLKNQVAMAPIEAEDGTVIVAERADITDTVLEAMKAAGVREIRAAPRVPTEIACAQLCGLTHYRMRGYLHIDTEKQFADWMTREEEFLAEEEEEDY